MLKEHKQQMEKLQKKYRINRKFQQQFMFQMNFELKNNRNIANEFAERFPKIMQEKQFQINWCQNYEKISNIDTNTDQIIDSQMFLENKLELERQPLREEEAEIKIICQAFSQLSQHCEGQIYEFIHRKYQQSGGKRTFEELKEKIQSDLLYLIQFKTRSSFKKA